MRKNKYNERATRVLMDTFGRLQQHAAARIREKNNRKRRRRKGSDGHSVIQDKHSSYPFIPKSVHVVLPQLIYAYDYLRKKYDRHNFSFLDAGCGFGNIMMLAGGIGFDVCGLEFDPVTIEFAASINPYWKEIRQQDILTYNGYGKFDVIYYYCPFCCRKETEFEKRVENQMKVGAILIAYGSLHGRMAVDKHFRELIFRSRRTDFYSVITSAYEKIKE